MFKASLSWKSPQDSVRPSRSAGTSVALGVGVWCRISWTLCQCLPTAHFTRGPCLSEADIPGALLHIWGKRQTPRAPGGQTPQEMLWGNTAFLERKAEKAGGSGERPHHLSVREPWGNSSHLEGLVWGLHELMHTKPSGRDLEPGGYSVHVPYYYL